MKRNLIEVCKPRVGANYWYGVTADIDSQSATAMAKVEVLSIIDHKHVLLKLLTCYNGAAKIGHQPAGAIFQARKNHLWQVSANPQPGVATTF